jgi:hypothetical protein
MASPWCAVMKASHTTSRAQLPLAGNEAHVTLHLNTHRRTSCTFPTSFPHTHFTPTPAHPLHVSSLILRTHVTTSFVGHSGSFEATDEDVCAGGAGGAERGRMSEGGGWLTSSSASFPQSSAVKMVILSAGMSMCLRTSGRHPLPIEPNPGSVSVFPAGDERRGWRGVCSVDEHEAEGCTECLCVCARDRGGVHKRNKW